MQVEVWYKLNDIFYISNSVNDILDHEGFGY